MRLARALLLPLVEATGVTMRGFRCEASVIESAVLETIRQPTSKRTAGEDQESVRPLEGGGECPSTDTILGFCAGQLEPGRSRSFRHHLELCPACMDLVTGAVNDWAQPAAADLLEVGLPGALNVPMILPRSRPDGDEDQPGRQPGDKFAAACRSRARPSFILEKFVGHDMSRRLGVACPAMDLVVLSTPCAKAASRRVRTRAGD